MDDVTKIKQYLKSLPNFTDRCAEVVGKSIDWTLDNRHTGRTKVDELSKTEKTIIGTKCEQYFKDEFLLQDGKIFD
ncbi:unnamed protein product, partial [marine sediment metagenome]